MLTSKHNKVNMIYVSIFTSSFAFLLGQHKVLTKETEANQQRTFSLAGTGQPRSGRHPDSSEPSNVLSYITDGEKRQICEKIFSSLKLLT